MFHTYNHSQIDEVTVRASLDEMARATASKTPNPLLKLCLVSAYMMRCQMLDTPYYRQYALQTLLSDLIATQYNQLRITYQLPVATLTESFMTTQEMILTDVQINNQELMSWCWLYYRYVRVDLDLSVEQLAQLSGAVARTIRRQIERGVYRLTQILIQQEYDTRSKYRHHRLHTALPPAASPQFIGRTEDFQAMSYLFPQLTPKHLLITGEAGIGKTAFVRELVWQYIQEMPVDTLIWIDQPTSIQQIYLEIQQATDYSDSALSAYASTCDLIVVIDGIQWLEYPEIAHFLNQLSFAIVVLVNRTCPEALSTMAQYALGSLDENDSRKLIQLYSDIHFLHLGWAVDEQEIDTIRSGMTGNPAHIIRAIHQYWEDK